MSAKPVAKIECLNPNTGGRMNIDANVYDLFSKAIYHTLKKNKQAISYTDIVRGVKQCFKEKRTSFKGSIEWYSVTIKNDMMAKGIIDAYIDKGKKLHSLRQRSLSK